MHSRGNGFMDKGRGKHQRVTALPTGYVCPLLPAVLFQHTVAFALAPRG